MKFRHHINLLSTRSNALTVGFLFLLFNNFIVMAQNSVTKNHDLDFGTFGTTGSAGTLTLSPTGTITSTGGITSIGTTYSPATLHVTFAGNRSKVTISYSPTTVNLAGSNGGVIKLVPTQIGTVTSSNHADIDINIGGTLTIDATTVDPIGFYSGTLFVYCTFSH